MKYLIPLLLAVVSMSACGQKALTHATHDNSGPTVPWHGGGDCHPKSDTKPGEDDETYEVFNCDTKTKKWVIDQEASKIGRARLKKEISDYKTKAEAKTAHLKALRFALVSRVINEKEMGEVAQLGTEIFDEPFQICGGASSCGFSGDYHDLERNHELYLSRKFNEAVAQQFKLRAIAAEHPRPTGNNCLAINTPEARACMGMLPTDPEPMGSYYCGSHDCSLPFPMPITGCPTGTSPVQHGGADQFECRPGSATSP